MTDSEKLDRILEILEQAPWSAPPGHTYVRQLNDILRDLVPLDSKPVHIPEEASDE